jgi:hypothetical protein
MGVRQKSESDTIVVKLKNKTLTTTPAFAYAYLRCRIATRGTIYLIATYTTAWNKFTTFPLVSIGGEGIKEAPPIKDTAPDIITSNSHWRSRCRRKSWSCKEQVKHQGKAENN